ncbi:MAG: hypothetical protein V4543_06555 [Bacteroidota bacterium]
MKELRLLAYRLSVLALLTGFLPAWLLVPVVQGSGTGLAKANASLEHTILPHGGQNAKADKSAQKEQSQSPDNSQIAAASPEGIVSLLQFNLDQSFFWSELPSVFRFASEYSVKAKRVPNAPAYLSTYIHTIFRTAILINAP